MSWEEINILEDQLRQESDWQDRVKAIEKMVGLGVPDDDVVEDRAVVLLEKLADDPKWEVRRAVAEALPLFRFTNIQGVLEKLNADSNRWVRESAEWARKRLRISTNIDKRDRKYDEIVRLVRQLKKKYPNEMTNEVMFDVLKVAFMAGEKYYEELANEAIHQVKTVMSSFSVATDSLESEIKKNGHRSDTVETLLADIALEKDNLSRIFTDLMQYATPWNADFSFENVASIIGEALSQARAHASNVDFSGIREIKEIDPSIQFEVNRVGMVQAIRNLIVNALEAMKGGGTLTLKATAIPKGIVTITVSDTGVGMTQKQIEDFKRIGTTSKRDEKIWRTGLGLPFALKVIELGHDSRVTWQSDLNKGTTIKLDVPVQRGENHD